MTVQTKASEQYFTVMLIVFNFTQLVILENLSALDFALSGVKGLRWKGIQLRGHVFSSWRAIRMMVGESGCQG